MPDAPAILLIGPDGMLGRAWAALLDVHGLVFDAAVYPDFDLTDPASVEQAIQTNHRLVINCAAWTDVDGAEAREEAAAAVNATGAGHLARRCEDVGAKLIHYSTDYVFPGNSDAPYRPEQPREPLGAYGRTKAAGEALIEQHATDYLIIRTSWLYAPWGNNFVLTMLRLTAEKDQLKVVHDQRGRPTSAEHLAASSLGLIEQGARGIYHVTDGGECTWYELTREIARQAGHACDVQPCTTAEFPRPAPRPAYSVLDLSKTEDLLGPMPPWPENLRAVLENHQGTKGTRGG